MPRANRCFLPGQVWHITHRCHEKSFLLKFARDRRTYRRWLFEAKKHLHRCLVYIDLNMVRAGVVRHPAGWAHGGYREIQDRPERYELIDLEELSGLCGFSHVADFQHAHRQWVAEGLACEPLKRDERWSESIAVGSQAFVEKIKDALNLQARYRDISGAAGTYALREAGGAYNVGFGTKMVALRPKKRRFSSGTTANT